MQPCTDVRNEGEGSKLSLEAPHAAQGTQTICQGATSDDWGECNDQCSVITGVFRKGIGPEKLGLSPS